MARASPPYTVVNPWLQMALTGGIAAGATGIAVYARWGLGAPAIAAIAILAAGAVAPSVIVLRLRDRIVARKVIPDPPAPSLIALAALVSMFPMGWLFLFLPLLLSPQPAMAQAMLARYWPHAAAAILVFSLLFAGLQFRMQHMQQASRERAGPGAYAYPLVRHYACLGVALALAAFAGFAFPAYRQAAVNVAIFVGSLAFVVLPQWIPDSKGPSDRLGAWVLGGVLRGGPPMAVWCWATIALDPTISQAGEVWSPMLIGISLGTGAFFGAMLGGAFFIVRARLARYFARSDVSKVF